MVEAEATRLNVKEMTPESCLEQLCTDKVGGILLVTMFPGTTIPFMTVVAAPSIVTHNATMGERGILYDDVWEDTVLMEFKPDLEVEKPHCPMLGAQEGFTLSNALQPGMFDLLQEAQPLFFPMGELVSESVQVDNVTHLRAYYLPEVCNLPLDYGGR